MSSYCSTVIKSFKHDGHLHRMWMENWLVPADQMHPAHVEESMIVMINSKTPIQEASGEQWVSKVPGVSFFIPKTWYNIVALIEPQGIRYYCNIASPPHLHKNVLTYIDYDLDVIVPPAGSFHVVDKAEYEKHKSFYRYSKLVDMNVKQGLQALLNRVKGKLQPFDDALVHDYMDKWRQAKACGQL